MPRPGQSSTVKQAQMAGFLAAILGAASAAENASVTLADPDTTDVADEPQDATQTPADAPAGKSQG